MDWFAEHFGWMYWTRPTAIAFGALFGVIALLVVWDWFSPSYPRKGFLPMATTRGDRLFVSIVSAIGLTILWLGIVGNVAVIVPGVVALCGFGVIFRWG